MTYGSHLQTQYAQGQATTEPAPDTSTTAVSPSPILFGVEGPVSTEDLSAPAPPTTSSIWHVTPPEKNVYIAAQSLIIVSIGSSHRQKLLQIQAAKLKDYVTLYQFTETNLPKCIVCSRVHKGRDHPEREHLGNPRFQESYGWWCAQKRPLMAAYDVLKNLEKLPDFFMMIDDDTVVNPFALRKFLSESAQVVNIPAYFGHICTHMMNMGGGGTVITKAVLKLWKGKEVATPWAPLRWCIEQTQGGEWCHWHSDWAYGQCVNIWSGANATDMHHLFNQNREPCTPHHVACHQRVEAQDWAETWNHIAIESMSATSSERD